MQKFEYTSVNVGPGESWYDQLRTWGENGWEAWHIEKTAEGWREVYFKRHKIDVCANQQLKDST